MIKQNDFAVTREWLVEKKAPQNIFEILQSRISLGFNFANVLLRDIERLANNDERYADVGDWLVTNLPVNPTTLVLEKVIGNYLFQNGNVKVKEKLEFGGRMNIKGELHAENGIVGTKNCNISAKIITAAQLMSDGFCRFCCDKFISSFVFIGGYTELRARQSQTDEMLVFEDACVYGDVFTYKIEENGWNKVKGKVFILQKVANN